jgi:flavin reductase (DIM6/NTAB) family NADH-FMN oxidoreductase RutF
VDQRRFRDVLGRFASGVTIVTASTTDGPVGFTCQSFTALSLEPPMVALVPSKQSTSWPRIAAAGAFCVNILHEGQVELSRTFAVPGAVRPDKFSGTSWHRGPSGAPVLDGVLAWVECELEMVHDAGDHEIVLGRVVDLGVGSGEPLLFYRGTFGRLARGGPSVRSMRSERATHEVRACDP